MSNQHIKDRESESIHQYFFSELIDDLKPACFDEAKSIKKWENVMDEEMKTLFKNKIWYLISKSMNVDLQIGLEGKT